MFEARQYCNTHEIIWNRASFGDFRYENKFLAGVSKPWTFDSLVSRQKNKEKEAFDSCDSSYFI